MKVPRNDGWRPIATMALAAALLAATTTARPALGQGGAPPPDVSAEIAAAIKAGEAAAGSAALTAGLTDARARTEFINQTRARAQETAIAEAVVRGIAKHPDSVSAIVRGAVERAPIHRGAVVYRARIAFPAFAPQIVVAAGGEPTVSPSAYATTPAFAARPAYVPRPAYTPQPAPVPPRVAAAAAPPLPAMTAAAPQAPILPFGLSEVRLGVVDHDGGVFGRSEERGIDVTLEARFAPFAWGFWETIWRPRPHVGMNVNTAGFTSSVYLGLTWDWTIWGPVFGSFAFGGALHNGETSTTDLDRKELGSRVLFRGALELGYRFLERHALALRLDHMSNASLTDKNEGMDTLGIVYGYSF